MFLIVRGDSIKGYFHNVVPMLWLQMRLQIVSYRSRGGGDAWPEISTETRRDVI